MMDNYGEKLMYLYEKQTYQCPICHDYMSMNEALDLHHRAHRHKWRVKKFPLFIDSLLNLELCHSTCHLNKGMGSGHISDMQAEKWERFLERHKKIAQWVNNP
jgi:hypothetical protein